MGLSKLVYNDNDQEHRGFADTLGQLQGGIEAGTYTKTTMHAYYAGHELRDSGVSWEGYYLKKDCTGSGKTANGRSKNRVIVALTDDDDLVEGWAVAWRHDDRLLSLDEGFFKRAKTMRDYVLSLMATK